MPRGKGGRGGGRGGKKPNTRGNTKEARKQNCDFYLLFIFEVFSTNKT